jgi:hypothetical protein
MGWHMSLWNKKKKLPYVRVLYVATGIGIGGHGVEVSYKFASVSILGLQTIFKFKLFGKR